MAFDPKKHLMKIQGKSYLPVAQRIVWFREVHPDWGIETQSLEINSEKQYAIFQATIRNEQGRIMAMATKREDVKGFGDYIEKAECVPVNTQILTARGWMTHDNLVIGELVLSYDVANDVSEWVPLERVITYDAAPVIRLHNGKGFDATCTPDHKWPTFSVASGPSVRYEYRKLVETSKLKTSHRLTVSCPAPDGELTITPRDAALIGWLITDGSIRRVGNSIRAYICQSKPPTVAIIRELLNGIAHLETSKDPYTHTFPTGKTYDCLKSYRWNLRAGEVRALFARLGIAEESRITDVLAGMTSEAREAMFEAMMQADGTEKGDFGKIRHPWVVGVFSQLCALQGKMLCAIRTNSYDFPTQRVKKAESVYASNLQNDDAGTEDVWCPTTKHGTWYARFDNGMTVITGNTGAVGRALALCGFGTQFDASLHEGADRVVDSPQEDDSEEESSGPVRTKSVVAKAATTTKKAARTPSSEDHWGTCLECEEQVYYLKMPTGIFLVQDEDGSNHAHQVQETAASTEPTPEMLVEN